MYFIMFFILKSPPISHPLCTFYAHPSYVQNTVTTTVHSSHETKNYECSATCPSLYLHGYGGPTGCPWVELCTSWHGWQGGWHLPSCLLSSSLLPREGHPRLPWPNVGRMPFLPLPLSIVWGQFLSPPSFSFIHAY